ncbi:MAG: DUF881 domain-containing protein [Clostridia bacterium]|nr:DUF881 domain-containing protein [Clostridia bacterium]
MKKIKPAITLGILAMVLTIGISVQLKTITAADISGTIQLTDSNLKKSVLQWKSRYEESNQKLKDTDKQLIDLRNNVANLQSDEQTKQKIQKYQTILGMTDVQGEGVIITVADNDKVDLGNSFSSINSSSYIVHDGNLVAIINELKSAGAEAISINGKRIVSSTSITCAGNVIQINGEKVGSPFQIKAIGSKDLLYGELSKNGGTLYKLKEYGVLTNIKKVDNVSISKNI